MSRHVSYTARVEDQIGYLMEFRSRHLNGLYTPPTVVACEVDAVLQDCSHLHRSLVALRRKLGCTNTGRAA